MAMPITNTHFVLVSYILIPCWSLHLSASQLVDLTDAEFSLTTENVSGADNQNLEVNSSSYGQAAVMHGTAYGQILFANSSTDAFPIITPILFLDRFQLPPPIWAIGFALAWVLYGGLCCWYGHKQMRIQEMQKNASAEDTPEASAIEQILINSGDTVQAPEWDWYKSIVMWGVVLTHTHAYFGNTQLVEFSSWMLIGQAIPLMIIISGVFSERVHTKYWLATLVGMPFAILSFNLLTWVVCLITPGSFNGKTNFNWSIDWYLYCLIGWRLIWPPLFCFTRRIKIPNLVTVAFSWLVTYFFLNSSLLSWLHDQGTDKYFPWSQFVYHMPTFTFGLLYSSKEWTNILFRSYRVNIAAFFLFPLHYGAMFFWKDYKDWTSPFCGHIGGDYVFHGRHVSCSPGPFIPKEFHTHSISIQTLGTFLFITFMKVASFLVFVPWAGMIFRGTRYFSPLLAKLGTDNGTRSMYSYLLHWCLWIVPGIRTGFAARVMSWYTPHDHWNSSDVVEIVVAWPLAVVVLHILGSELSERVFSFMVMTPFWVVEYLGILGTAAKTGKSESQ